MDTEYWKAFLKNNQELQPATKKTLTLQYNSRTMQVNWNKLFGKRLLREDHRQYLIADMDHRVDKASMFCRVKTAYLGQILVGCVASLIGTEL